MSASRDIAFSLAGVLAEHNGIDVVVLDVAVQSGWTDFFVIATATSTIHMRGLAKFLDESAEKLGADRLNKPHIADDEDWLLVDLGDIVVHLMTEKARAFYELEKLWFQSQPERVAAPLPPQSRI